MEIANNTINVTKISTLKTAENFVTSVTSVTGQRPNPGGISVPLPTDTSADAAARAGEALSVAKTASNAASAPDEGKGFDNETLTEMVKETVDLISRLDRSLKYEVHEEAGVVQVQVIDDREGRVIRKVPADEVIKLLQAMKEKLADRVDVWA